MDDADFGFGFALGAIACFVFSIILIGLGGQHGIDDYTVQYNDPTFSVVANIELHPDAVVWKTTSQAEADSVCAVLNKQLDL